MRKQPPFWLVCFIVTVSTLAFADPSPVQKVFVYIPQTDDQSVNVLKLFDRYPKLRLVWAVSPRFFRDPKRVELKAKLQELESHGRIALGLQIPNAPFLPLLLNSADASGALPVDSSLLSPPYASSDDVVQHVSRAKNDFVKSWGTAPKGIVLPFGAISPALARWFQSQSFDWVVAALGHEGPAVGPYQLDILLAWKKVVFWDGALPPHEGSTLVTQVWDERYQKGSGLKTLEAWAKSLNKENVVALLPGDGGLPEPQKLADAAIQKRTWSDTDWSAWIGTPEKNAVWSALFKTRQALEAYQNSGQAVLPRLEAASEELLTAQNSSFMMAAGSVTLSDIEREDKTRDFEATLGSVYRLIGQTPPDDLLKGPEPSADSTSRSSQSVFSAEGLPGGNDHIRLSDSKLNLDVVASSETLTWIVSRSSALAQSAMDLYVDINGLPNVGSTSLLPGRDAILRPEDAWEYALEILENQATLYVTQSGNQFIAAGNFPVVRNGQRVTISLPRAQMRGNLRHWGYRVLALDKSSHVSHALERHYH